jgi:hypothetical protein
MKSQLLSLLLSLPLVVTSSHVLAARPEPQAQVDAFLRTANEKGGSAAIEDLCKGTLLEEQKKAEITAVAPQLDAVFKIYGKTARVENVDKKNFGESFLRLRVISYHHSGAPLFWEFLFFKNKGEWQIYVFRFNDQFAKVFTTD